MKEILFNLYYVYTIYENLAKYKMKIIFTFKYCIFYMVKFVHVNEKKTHPISKT